MEIQLAKNNLRNEMKVIRKALSRESVDLASSDICKQVLGLKEFMDADLVLGYLPIQNEVDPRAILELSNRMGKMVAVPKVIGDDIEYLAYQSDTFTRESSFHVEEPLGDDYLEINRYSRIFMMVPGLAFDHKGGRLGFGKGFYDRYLSKHQELDIYTVGLAYAFQICDRVPTEDNDYLLNMIITAG